MAVPKIATAQNDFSAGELNIDAKRSDDPLVKTGGRQMSNFRILNTRKLTNRPGRLALFPTDGRTDEVQVAPGTIYRLCFGDGLLKIRDSNGAYVAGTMGYIWTKATANQIVWALVTRSSTERDVVMAFPGQRPKIARWSSTAGWTFLDFAFSQSGSGAVHEPFYRLAPASISLTPTHRAGAITVAASEDYFTAAMIGTVVRWIGHQILLTAYTSAISMDAIVIEQLPATLDFDITGLQGDFNVGDAVGTTTSPRENYEGEVASVVRNGSGDVTHMSINMFVTGQKFQTTDIIVGPNGTCVSGTISIVLPQASREWDEEVMNANRGWPSSCFFDQDRLGFCNMPGVPGGIIWSRIGSYDDFLVGANPADPMFEIAPNRARVLHVANRSDEFVLTDRGIWYIPISSSNPLKPGSVQFLKVSSDAALDVAPVETVEAVLFVGASGNRMVAIVPKYGYLNIPWGTIETSLYHSHLFNNPVAIAVATSDGDFQERYVYVLNSDGSMAVGKFDVAREWAGWLPWNGSGVVSWVSVRAANVIFTTTYTGLVGVTIAEQMTAAQYIDGSLAINVPASGMVAGQDGVIETLLTGTAGTNNMTDRAAASAAFDGNPLKNLVGSPGVTAPAVGYGNRIWLVPAQGAQKVRRMRLTAPLDAPFSAAGATTFKIIGSNNGVSWTTLFTSASTLGTNGEVVDVTTGIDHAVNYTYFGVDFSGTSAKPLSVALIEPFYEPLGVIHQAPNGGTGPMWWLAGGQAEVMDGVQTFAMHDIDASGNVVPIDAEDLSSATMMAGLKWSSTFEPFIPHAAPGTDIQQRMRRRRISKALVSAQGSTGFTLGDSRVPSWFTGENQEIAPPVRENSYAFRPRGRSYDPRITLTKDTPGPFTLIEVGFEVTV